MSASMPISTRRVVLDPCHRVHCSFQQVRHATLIRRPKRPYTFTQLVTLSDGSTYLHRTTSPIPVYKATKDVRNSPLWNPSSRKLLNVEDDEAGKLAGFRSRFGRAWDSESSTEPDDKMPSESADTTKAQRAAEPSLMDMIGSYENKAERTPTSKETQGSSSSKGSDGKKR